LNAKTALLGLFVALTIIFASTTVYESGIRTTLASTSIAIRMSTVTSTTTQTTTVTSTLDLTNALQDAYRSHIGAIESQNATALAAQYEINATLNAVAIGNPPKGSFFGIANITKFYEEVPANICVACPSLKAPFAVANETYSVTMSSDDKAGNVTSNLVFYGNTSVEGACYVPNVGSCQALAYVVGFDISYLLQGDHWLISMESLTYTNSYQCLTVSLSPDGSVLSCHQYLG
jgi:hypothetical protein